jgi:zinc transport system ATP-binding protein
MAEPLISARNITILEGGERILDGVSLDIAPREIVTLIGPNGSGKTTLVRALLGLIALDGGDVVRRATRIAYVPQFFARDRSLPLTARRFVAGSGSDADARAALTQTGAIEAADRQLASLSGGEMARVALARALLRRPEILFLDEPLAGVDLGGEAALYELIARVRDETGAAIFLVSHDLHIVMATADRVVCLNHHVCCEGDAKAVVRDPAFVALFGPGLAAQLAVYTHRHDHDHAPSGAVLAGHVHHGHSHG